MYIHIYIYIYAHVGESPDGSGAARFMNSFIRSRPNP